MHIHTDNSPVSGVPPIVLLAEDDVELAKSYANSFDAAGMWVATAAAPRDAVLTARELRPDVVVADLATGRELIHALRSQAETRTIPIVRLGGGSSGACRLPADELADLWLVKPVPPAALLEQVRKLLQKSRDLRRQSEAATMKSTALRERSGHLLDRSRRLVTGPHAAGRPCPQCGRPLRWIERGRLGGVEYDYYRWCEQGCGLFACDPAAGKWVKLA